MRSDKEWVDNNVKILDVLDRLGYSYRGAVMLEGGKKTDGWKVYFRENMVKDFSKERPSGSPWVFVWHHFNKDASATEQWYKENYNLPNKKHKHANNTRKISKAYASF